MDPANDYLLPCPYCEGTGGRIGYPDDDDDDDEPTGLPPIDPPEVPNGENT